MLPPRWNRLRFRRARQGLESRLKTDCGNFTILRLLLYMGFYLEDSSEFAMEKVCATGKPFRSDLLNIPRGLLCKNMGPAIRCTRHSSYQRTCRQNSSKAPTRTYKSPEDKQLSCCQLCDISCAAAALPFHRASGLRCFKLQTSVFRYRLCLIHA